jgi:hypothetical protein
MTTNIQLDEFMKKQKKTFAPFVGVFPSDKLPKINKGEDFCLITNYDPSFKNGSHWVALSVKGDKAYWFDSYGMKPDGDDLILDDKTRYMPYLLKYSDDIIYNHIDLQALDSEVCGLYACYFCIHGLPAKNKDAWKMFTSNTKNNDKRIQTLVKV